MASVASLANLGSVNMASVCKFDRSSVCLVGKVSFHRNGSSFRRFYSGKRWRYVGVCRYSLSTDYLGKRGTSVSLDSANGGGKDNGIDALLKMDPKPVLRSEVKVDPLLGMSGDESKLSRDSRGMDEERSAAVESLGDVLDRAEKLQLRDKANVSEYKPGVAQENNGRPVNSDSVDNSNCQFKTIDKGNVSVYRPSSNRQPQQNYGKPAKTMKSVWRKGNPVAYVQKVKEPLKQEPKTNGGIVNSRPVAPPRLPQKIQPQLQAKPSVAPPPPPPPSIRKPVILKDLYAGPKAPVILKDFNAGPKAPVILKDLNAGPKAPVILKDLNAGPKAPVADGTDSNVKPKANKPILIDKFASKKLAVDPATADAVSAPSKPMKSPPLGKLKNDFRKRSGAVGAQRRRKVGNEADNEEDMAELGVSAPRSPSARKGRKWSKASRRAVRLQAARAAEPVKVEIMEVEEDGMFIDELAYNLAIGEGHIYGYFFSKGIRPTGVQKLSREMVKMVCKEHEVEVIDAVTVGVEEMAKKKEILDEDDLDKLEDRPPVLTIMGHVDHGKTTLLDYIRKTKVAASEAGGITQGIGAYKVQVPVDGKSQTCVFLDTPGHEAFGAMRARGARVTDIAVIVVAADDGIQPQTSEAIAHAKAAGVPIIVAINKIDKDGANPDRVIQDLSSVGLMPEDWGGDTPMVKISALKGENVDELLETIMLVAELQELKANPHRNAKGTVIEAGLDKAKGPVATFIVQNGTLKKGDIIACGEAFGKARALFDDKGARIDEAGPSIPVQVIGLNNVPLAGDEFEVVSSLDIAREKAESREEDLRNEWIIEKAGDGKITLSSLASAVSKGRNSGLDLHQLNIILKVDRQGSIEAVRQALMVLPQENISLKFLLKATGDVSTSDVDLAVTSKAIIFGFNVRVSGSVKSYASQRGVEIRLYKVIYELIDDVKKAMEGLLDLVEEEVPIGTAEVRAVFSSGSGRVAGCMVMDGKLVKDCRIRVMRKNKEVYVGVLGSLKRVKENAKEVNSGLECGIGVEDFGEWVVDDTILAFNTVQKKRTLEEASATMSVALEELRRQI